MRLAQTADATTGRNHTKPEGAISVREVGAISPRNRGIEDAGAQSTQMFTRSCDRPVLFEATHDGQPKIVPSIEIVDFERRRAHRECDVERPANFETGERGRC